MCDSIGLMCMVHCKGWPFVLTLWPYSKIVELEEELKVVGNNMKSLEISEQEVKNAHLATWVLHAVLNPWFSGYNLNSILICIYFKCCLLCSYLQPLFYIKIAKSKPGIDTCVKSFMNLQNMILPQYYYPMFENSFDILQGCVCLPLQKHSN